MSAPLENYLRTFRKRSGLSQDEVASLLGCACGAKVSRYERRAMHPKLETALAFQVIFRVPVEDLFAGLYRKVEKTTLTRARLLAQKLAGGKGRSSTARKLALLESLTSAASEQNAKEQ